MSQAIRVKRVWRPFAVVLVLCLFSAAAVDAKPAGHPPGLGWTPRAERFPAVVAVQDVAVEMSDGVTVYADVFLPSTDGANAAAGRFPVVMMITPYNKNFGAERREFLVKRGYVSVVAEPRGTGSSEGVWSYGSDRERRDGFELVEWAAVQEWSTGAVGMVGDSYRGINQWWTAAEQPPHLRAIIPINAPADSYRTGGMSGGAMSSLVAAQGLVGVLGIPPGNRTVEDPRAAAQTAATRPLGIGLGAAGTADIAAGGKQSFDGTYYHQRSGYWQSDRITVPTLIIGGWWDIAQRDSVLMFEELQRRRVPVKLIMGTWTHSDFGAGLPTDVDGGLPYTLDELFLRWFDHYLSGQPDPSLRQFGPVVYSDQGREGFRSAASWPPPEASYQRLFLSGTAVPGGAGTLVTSENEVIEGADPLPWNPTAGLCSRSTRQALLGAPPDNPCSADGSVNDANGIMYDLAPADVDRRLAGPIAAHLSVSTTRNDAFINVRVEDVAPDGQVAALTDGNDTLSFRALDLARTRTIDGLIVRPFHPYTRESVEVIESARVYDWWIEVLPTAAVIKAGHRLRITVQSADAGQAVPVGERALNAAGGTLTVHHDREHQSFVAIPFLSN